MEKRIGASLQGFLAAMEEFFDGQERFVAGRRARATEFLDRLDTIPAGLPRDLQREIVEKWMKLKGYFIGVAHHGSADEPSFRKNLSRLETFLAARLRRRPTDSIAVIDALLREE